MAEKSLIFHLDRLWSVARSLVGSGKDPVAAGFDIKTSRSRLGLLFAARPPYVPDRRSRALLCPARGTNSCLRQDTGSLRPTCTFSERIAADHHAS